MTINDIFPVLIAALVVIVIIALKVTEIRTNNRRKAEGKAPLTEEQQIVNVIDWSRRR